MMPAPAMFGEEDHLFVPRAKKRRISSRPEQAVQMAIIRRVSFYGIVCAAVTNEGKRSTLAGLKAKQAGLIRGFPDIIAMQAPGRIAYLECKEPKWKPPSDDAKGEKAAHYRAQVECHDMLRRLGFFAGFVTSQDEAVSLLRQAGFKC